MNISFRRASSLTAIGIFAIIVSTPASASDAGETASFKMAMGPMSAAQKNQGPGAMAGSDSIEPKPHHHAKHHRRHHHKR